MLSTEELQLYSYVNVFNDCFPWTVSRSTNIINRFTKCGQQLHQRDPILLNNNPYWSSLKSLYIMISNSFIHVFHIQTHTLYPTLFVIYLKHMLIHTNSFSDLSEILKLYTSWFPWLLFSDKHYPQKRNMFSTGTRAIKLLCLFFTT